MVGDRVAAAVALGEQICVRPDASNSCWVSCLSFGGGQGTILISISR